MTTDTRTPLANLDPRSTAMHTPNPKLIALVATAVVLDKVAA